MAFTKTPINRYFKANVLVEEGSYALSGGSTTGTFTPETSGNGINAGITRITNLELSSDGNTAIAKNYNANQSNCLITTSANNTGTYVMEGFCA